MNGVGAPYGDEDDREDDANHGELYAQKRHGADRPHSGDKHGQERVQHVTETPEREDEDRDQHEDYERHERPDVNPRGFA